MATEGRHRVWLWLVKSNEEVLGGCFVVGHQHVVDVFMLSVSQRHSGQMPSFLLIERALVEAAAAGALVFNWQSSPGRNSGVYQYKKQWGALDAPYHFVTRRLCPAEQLAGLSPEIAMQTYPNHYVAPFAALRNWASRGRYQK